MSKLLRSELKTIVKECLVEILSEGLASSEKTISESVISKKTLPPRRKALDNISYNKKKKIKKTVLNSNITSDPILNEMLADTAVSTLQEQHAAERKSGSNVQVAGDAAAKLVAESNVEDLFGESSTKWASLAFS